MEVAAQTPTSSSKTTPFHDHDVREWSTLNSFGVLERARIETDHWATNTNNSSHKYGKVVDSRARTDADGALRQQARRQLEVFQSQIPGGQLQVIKTHSVSSSRWTNKKLEDVINSTKNDEEFEGLQIPLNPLDSSFQKSKAVIGRSAIRRPPTRIKNKEDSIASTNLQKVTRLCHQIHENAIKQSFGKYNTPIIERLNLTKITNNEDDKDLNEDIIDVNKKLNGHTNLSRTKSSSSEDFKSTKITEDLEDLEHLQTWRRSSKIRRSLQYHHQKEKTTTTQPKNVDIPEKTVNVKKITEDFEKGRRLSTAFRSNNLDLQALDQILQNIEEEKKSKPTTTTKRDSFVSVETLKEIKGRLRRTSSSKENDIDDGIVTEEEKMIEPTKNKVKSYIFGMELNKNLNGTGSLESRTKLNGTTNRNDDWYNRRKSYGFEQVKNDQNDPISSSSSKKNFVESSTDSGICRSSEIIVIPTVIKNEQENSNDEDDSDNYSNVKRITSIFNNTKKNDSIGVTIKISNNYKDNEKRHSIAVDETKYVSSIKNKEDPRRTSLVINSNDNNDDFSSVFNKKLKKVEFCKTEVHFTAESGKVNIVETDEKPPPTQNFRRRRRNTFNYLNNEIPNFNFGDNQNDINDQTTKITSNVTVNSDFNFSNYDDEKKEENENIKGILKNKLVKPIPYHLGDNNDDWLLKNQQPIWKSTVTVSNKFFDTTNQPDLIKHQLKKLTEIQHDEKIKYLSVAERIKNMEENQKNDNYKGYSTRVNIGDGKAIVVETNGLNVDGNDLKVSRIFNQTTEAFSNPEEPIRIKAEIKNKKYSPIVLRKHPIMVRQTENLSSPSLVGKSTETQETKLIKTENFIKNEKILRTPNVSEMTYFGVQSKPESPIYENISPASPLNELKNKKEFDSCILDELTKAADEILQVVKEYSEEENKKQKKIELTTIKENKSWKKNEDKIKKPIDRLCKTKSLETTPKDIKLTQRYITNTKSSADKIKPKTTNGSSDSSGLKASTKARRLQRASSREALLQSHGSSSEDLTTNEIPLRKPRLVRKTKTTQLTLTNGMDIKKNEVRKKTEAIKTTERLPGALPEIRHKTAVSTIRSIAEKTANRDRSKHVDKKKTYKDVKASIPVNQMKKRETVTHRLATANIKKCSDKH